MSVYIVPSYTECNPIYKVTQAKFTHNFAYIESSFDLNIKQCSFHHVKRFPSILTIGVYTCEWNNLSTV